MRHARFFRYKILGITYTSEQLFAPFRRTLHVTVFCDSQAGGLLMKNPATTKPRRGDLWINPRSNLKGPGGNSPWNNGGNINPQSGAGFLELADIALGLQKPLP